MKTPITFFKLYTVCAKFGFLLSGPHSQSGHGSTSLLPKLLRRVFRDVRASLLALRTSLNANNRLYYGLLLLAVIAPASNVAYLLFDRSAGGTNWFYVNYFYFLLVQGPYFFILFSLMGIFLLFPANSKRAYALIIPSGYIVAKIIWLCTATSNDDFNRFVPGIFIVVGMMLTSFLMVAFNYITHRKFHEYDAIMARLEGIANLKGITDKERKEMVSSTLSDLKKYETSF